MKIDKSRFLALTGAIAAATMVSVGAAGCVITTNDKDSTEADDKTPGTDAGVIDETDADAATPDDPDASDASDANEPDPPACLDDAGPTPDCSDALPTSCAEVCDSVLDGEWGLQSGVLQDMMDCLGSLQSCDDGILSDEAWACRDNAVAKACVTNEATEICAPLVASCATEGWEALFTQEACEKTVAAIDESVRATFVDCVTEGFDDFCTADPMYCLVQTEDIRIRE